MRARFEKFAVRSRESILRNFLSFGSMSIALAG
jgi:hypothetical protein